jgi:uncharacterized protein YcgL (UPF0745 family)
MSSADVESVTAILSNREYYFDLREPWNQVLPQLEACIRREGAIGLAKVESYLYVLKKKEIVPQPEVARFSESVNRLLLREMSDVLGETPKQIEERLARPMRHKLSPDQ